MSNLETYPSRIIGVQFGTSSFNDIVNTSVCEVRNKETYSLNRPTTDGIMSPAMGPASDLPNGKAMVCPTDGLGEDKSPGYFGHIHFKKPIIWLQHINEIKRIMETVCVDCGTCRVDISRHPQIMCLPIDKRPTAVKKLIKKDKKCRISSCLSVYPSTIKHVNMANIAAEYKRKTDTSVVVYSPTMMLTLFKRISDATCAFIGCNPVFARPENLICQAFPVPPPQMRPSTKAGDSQRKAEDDITLLLQRIVQENNEINSKIVESEAAMEALIQKRRAEGISDPRLLYNIENEPQILDTTRAIAAKNTTIQYLSGAIVENKFRGGETPMQHQSGQAYTSLKTRLDGKGGRLRRNCVAKRVDVSARSVISGDPNVGVRFIGLPSEITDNLTKPVRITRLNKTYHETLLANRFADPVQFPNIQKILKRRHGNTPHRQRTVRPDTKLEIGDVVFRTLRDNDIALMNRAPSLTKMSIQAHRIKKMSQGLGIRLPPAVTPGYNADFDGDEMNAHVPQSVMAEAELYGQAAVANNIISNGKNAPVTGLVQDTMLGASLLTQKDRTLDPLEAMRMLSKTSKHKFGAFYDNCVDSTQPKKQVRPNDVLTCILPRITMKRNTGYLTHSDADKNSTDTTNLIVEIKDGKYIRGQLDKGSIMEGTNGIIHRIITDHGNEAGADFLDDMESVITEFMKHHSASVGIADMLQDSTTRKKINAVLDEGLDEARALVKHVHLGTFKNETSFTNKRWLELSTLRILEKTAKKAEKLGHDYFRGDKIKTVHSPQNCMNNMVYCGSKGKLVQLTEMSMFMGQQKMNGGRVQDDLNGRTLPHYTKYNMEPETRGFVRNSFMTGTTPLESNPHIKVARSGLTNTAVKTQETGYMQRRLVKFNENVRILYDNTVRNGPKIVQFRFGDDGSEPSKQLDVEIITFLTTSVKDMFARFEFYKDLNATALCKEAMARHMQEDQKQLIRENCTKYGTYLLDIQEFLVKEVFVNKVPTTVQCTVNFPVLIDTFIERHGLSSHFCSDITPFEAMERIEAVYQFKLNSLGVFNRPSEMFRALYFYYLTPKLLVLEHKFSAAHLDLLLNEVVKRYLQGLAHPGTNVGVIAGQVLGSEATQDTLNVFHDSGGQAAKSTRVVEGIPRTAEILRASTTKTPFVQVKLLQIENDVLGERYPEVFQKDGQTIEEARANANAADVSRMLERVVLRDLVDCISTIHCPSNVEPSGPDAQLIRRFRDHENLELELLGQAPLPASSATVVFRLQMNATLMAEQRVTMNDVDFCLRNKLDLAHGNYNVFSDMSDSNLIFRCPVAVHDLNSKLLKDAEDNVLNTPIRGVEGISDVIVVPDKSSLVWNDDKKQFEIKKDVPMLDATGNNLRGVLATEGVDTYRTWCNDIRTMKEVFGIESCRHMIISELQKTLSGANYAHISLLADKMTYGVDITPVWRTGIRDDNVGPFMKASFETTTEVFNEAARRGSLDDMCGVSANVICGQTGKFGTNAFQILMHPDKMSMFPQTEVQDDDVVFSHTEAPMNPLDLIHYVPPSKKQKTMHVPFELPLLF